MGMNKYIKEEQSCRTRIITWAKYQVKKLGNPRSRFELVYLLIKALLLAWDSSLYCVLT
jgi:hypothetical protein